jgi:hypothetical protein
LDEKGIAFSTGLITNEELFNAELLYEVDLDGDSGIGIQFSGTVFAVGKMIFGTTLLGYGFKPIQNSSVVLIPNALNPSGPYVSATIPGGGRIGVAVASVSPSKTRNSLSLRINATIYVKLLEALVCVKLLSFGLQLSLIRKPFLRFLIFWTNSRLERQIQHRLIVVFTRSRTKVWNKGFEFVCI